MGSGRSDSKQTLLIHGGILLALFGVLLAARLHTFDEPIERDLAVYAVTAHEMMQGRALYSDLWDHKPPAIHLTYELGELLAGYGQQEFFLLGLLGTALTLMGLYRLGSSAFGWQGGFWAAVLWTALSSDLHFEANQPNAETFINAALVWTLGLLVVPPRTRGRLIGAGILLAVASFYKPQAMLYAVLFPAVIWIDEEKGAKEKTAIASFFWLWVPALALWGATFLYFSLVGHSHDFYAAVFTFNKFYSTQRPTLVNLGMGFQLNNLLPEFARFLVPLLGIILVGGILGFRKAMGPWLFLAAYGIGIFLFVASSGQFLPHYYQLWFPFLALGGGWAIVEIGRWIKGWTPLPALTALWLIVPHELAFFSLTPHQWSDQKYHDHFLLSYDLSRSLSGILQPGDMFLHFGNETPLYFYTKTDPPTGLTYIYPFKIGPLADELTERLTRDLKTHPPDLVVLDNIVYPEYRTQYFADYDLWRYYPIDKRYALLVRKDSALEGRLKDDGRFFDQETVNRAD